MAWGVRWFYQPPPIGLITMFCPLRHAATALPALDGAGPARCSRAASGRPWFKIVIFMAGLRAIPTTY